MYIIKILCLLFNILYMLLTTRNENTCLQKDLYKNAHSSIIPHSSRVGTTAQMAVSKGASAPL